MIDTESTEDILLEVDLPHAPEHVWRALADGDLAREWLDTPDLRPEAGRHFQLAPADHDSKSPPVDCEVIEAVPNEKLRWRQLERESVDDAYAVSSIVTLDLLRTPDGTRLRIIHDSFRRVDLGRTVVSLAERREALRSRTPKITCELRSLRRAA